MIELPVTSPEPDLASYAYSYPHKSSYRALTPPVRIGEAWKDENTDGLSLYVHVPFCEMRCGFCNLFTQSQPASDNVERYLQALALQMKVVRSEVPHARFQQFAIGGGTPTLLSVPQLEDLISRIERTWNLSLQSLPTSVETSPATASFDRLSLLKDVGVQRISLGVQSFLDRDSRQIGRPQQIEQVYAALDRIRELGFEVLNIDLIYGDPQQSHASWLCSVQEALRYSPEELYLYPLYVRPQTGLASVGRTAVTHRQDLYRSARELLRQSGYEQTSLRGFRKPLLSAPSTYTCQRDGMIGLGCGARSYTRRLHYGTRFATTQAGVKAILGDWVSQSEHEFALATHGFRLSKEEQWRRYLIMSLLQCEGLLIAEFQALFPEVDVESLPEWTQLVQRGWAARSGTRWQLTEAGIENSDVVGPMLYSPSVRENLRSFVGQTHNTGEYA